MAKKTRSQLKTQSRKVLIVKSGGPAATTITRSAEVIKHFDDLIDTFKLQGEEVIAVSVAELQQLQADGGLAPGQLYQLTDGDNLGLLAGFNAADADLGNAQQGGSFGSYDVATGKFTPGLGGGGGLITLANITEFRDRFNATFTGTVQEFARRLLVKEQFPGYDQPSASLASSMQGYVERGTTIKPVLTPGFNQGNAGALTSYQLRRDGTQLASDNTAPIAYPAFTDTYKIGEEVVTYYATFGYAQGPLKLSDQGNPAPGRIGAGTVQAQASVSGAPRLFYGPTAGPSDTSAKARALPFSRLTVDGNQFILNTGTVALTFEIVAPDNLTVSVIDLDGFNAPMPYNASALQVQDAGSTPYGHKVWRLTIAEAYSASHRHQVTLS
ncbi:hypothetical protein [Hymenobacter sp. GOD-10R]|uniref:hypothetical protein n=1 Tax=Hymenobacter sp. GOD-10R TaxID=3093922 RepID=UPI002D7A2140|nr:hypothetical protein [Hymenobacter sp. GOD-10R]WRQ26670.1 hypothetical protein SD425_16480 [Hymenobacter sp. GOD-10R]